MYIYVLSTNYQWKVVIGYRSISMPTYGNHVKMSFPWKTHIFKLSYLPLNSETTVMKPPVQSLTFLVKRQACQKEMTSKGIFKSKNRTRVGK